MIPFDVGYFLKRRPNGTQLDHEILESVRAKGPMENVSLGDSRPWPWPFMGLNPFLLPSGPHQILRN